MTTTQQIVNQFTQVIDTDKEYTRSELGKILTQVYRDMTTQKKESKTDEPKKKRTKKSKDSDEEPKKKREPTAYNLFVKEHMPLVK